MSDVYVLLYSYHSDKEGMYPFHVQSLEKCVLGGRLFLDKPHDNAWVLIDAFPSFKEALLSIEYYEQRVKMRKDALPTNS